MSVAELHTLDGFGTFEVIQSPTADMAACHACCFKSTHRHANNGPRCVLRNKRYLGLDMTLKEVGCGTAGHLQPHDAQAHASIVKLKLKGIL